MKSVKIVTSTYPAGLELTKNFVSNVDKFFRGKFSLEVCYHNFDTPPEFSTSRIKVTTRNLDEDEDFKKFYTSDHPRNVKDSVWHDAIKWSPKVFAITKSVRDADYLLWMDNDVDIYEDITFKDLRLNGDFTYCYRPHVKQVEGCYLGFALGRLETNLFLDKVMWEYTSGNVWTYDILVDQFIFSRVMETIPGLKMNNLVEDVYGLEAFNQSPLYPKMYHNKGNKKALPYRNRYEQLFHLVDRYKPGVIVEVGTGPGGTAHLMIEAALRHKKKVTFYGFGLFEDETRDQQVQGYTTKVNKKVKDLRTQLKQKFGDRLNLHLIKGDSRKTLSKAPKNVDFAFIDGGHHLDIVSSDYANLKHSKVIVFDDYWTDYKYEDDPPEENRLAPLLDSYGVEILPSHDPCISILKPESREVSHITHLAVKINKGVPIPKNFVVNTAHTNVKVHPIDCVPKDDLKGNIVRNLSIIDKWFEPCFVHGRELVLVSGGLSLKDHLEEIRELQKGGAEIICVKHALPTLAEAGIVPEYCTVLDPRELEGTSTHGVVRKDLFNGAQNGTVFLVASMTNPEVTQYLKDKGMRLLGWHALTSSIQELGIRGPYIQGGSCSAARNVVFGINLGFRRKMHLFGYDFYVEEPPDEEKNASFEDGKRKYLPYQCPSKKIIWSTGELIAAIQDMIALFRQFRDIEFVVHGDSITKELHDSIVTHKLKEYEGKDGLWNNSAGYAHSSGSK